MRNEELEMRNGKTTGFASPAQGYEHQTIDLNALMIQHPAATFLFRLESGDMADLGLFRGALLVVDRSGCPLPGDYVLLAHKDRFLCRLLELHHDKKILTNGKEEIIPIVGETTIIGVVTSAIQVFRKGNK
jgi:DNA polymerase V